MPSAHQARPFAVRLSGGGIRERKRRLLALLALRPTPGVLSAWLAEHPPEELVDPLIAVLYRPEEHLHWPAVEALGQVLARLADQDMEAARIVVRRLMWSLNEESGGIGWGAPEAMGEILARHRGLAVEYRHILLSYLRADGEERWQHGNFLEHEGLQRGLLWGIARLRQARPDLVTAADIGAEAAAMLSSDDGAVRGLAARCLGLLADTRARSRLTALRSDDSPLSVWQEGGLHRCSVASLSREALARLEDEHSAERRCDP